MGLFKWLRKKKPMTESKKPVDSEMEKNYDFLMERDWAMYIISPSKISPVKLMDRVWEQ